MRWYSTVAFSIGSSIGACAGFLWPLLGGAMVWAGYGMYAWASYFIMPLAGALLGGIALTLAVNLLILTAKLCILAFRGIMTCLFNREYEPLDWDDEPAPEPDNEYVGGILNWGHLTNFGHGIVHAFQRAGVATREGFDATRDYVRERWDTLRYR